MSLFETLKKAIFHNPMAHRPPASEEAPSAPRSAAAPPTGGASTTPPRSTPRAPTPSEAPRTAQPAPTSKDVNIGAVDVEAVLEGMSARNPQKLNWRTSIVDLMKLVGMDSSLEHRKQLAVELGYHGDTNDSAAMNLWLHKAVMKKLAENGGKVPSTLQ